MDEWKSWAFLCLAIVAEVFAASSLKFFNDGIAYGYLIVFAGLAFFASLFLSSYFNFRRI